MFFGPSGQEQTLYYFTTDLADWARKGEPRFPEILRTARQGTALLKAASYLMHSNNFSQVRDFFSPTAS